MRIQKILDSARRTLADPNAQRWSDDDLLALLDEGQKDFAQQTLSLLGETDVGLPLNTPYFDLPPDCMRLTRILYNGAKLPFVSHAELDNRSTTTNGFFNQQGGADWESDTGSPLAYVYDRHVQTVGRVYPMAQDPFETDVYSFEGVYSVSAGYTNDFGVVTFLPNDDLSSDYGIVSAMPGLSDDFGVTVNVLAPIDTTPDPGFGVEVGITDFTTSPLLGLTADTSTDEYVVNPDVMPFGVISAMEDQVSYVHAYYIKNPADVTTVDDTLDINPMYDLAMKFYVTGQAFFNDLDAGNQQKGTQQLGIYDRHVANAKRERQRDFTSASAHQTLYRSGF